MEIEYPQPVRPVAGTMCCSNAVRGSHPDSARSPAPVCPIVSTIVRSPVIIRSSVTSGVTICMAPVIGPIDPSSTHDIFESSVVQILVHFQVINCDISHDILHVM